LNGSVAELLLVPSPDRQKNFSGLGVGRANLTRIIEMTKKMGTLTSRGAESIGSHLVGELIVREDDVVAQGALEKASTAGCRLSFQARSK
jgi:hypothetical protein